WLRRSGGAIVNVCDVRGERPLPGCSVYAAAKAGVVAITRSLALELAPQVRVNAVAPGSLDWPEDGVFTEEERRSIEAATPLHRVRRNGRRAASSPRKTAVRSGRRSRCSGWAPARTSRAQWRSFCAEATTSPATC